MQDPVDDALEQLIEAVARIPARRLPNREPPKKSDDQESQTERAGTKAT
jgi:hypothetical protein